MTIIGILLILSLIGLWQGVTANQAIFLNFANKNTGIILIAFAVAAILYGVMIACFYYSESKHKVSKLSSSLKGLAAAIPAFLGLTVCYAYFIYFANEICRSMADGLLMTIVVLFFCMPLFIIAYLIIIMLGLCPNFLPMFGLYACDGGYHPRENGTLGILLGEVYPYFICVVLSAGYIWLLTQTNFETYFRNIFR